VVLHQAKGMDPVSVTEDTFLYQVNKVPAIRIVKEYIRTTIAS